MIKIFCGKRVDAKKMQSLRNLSQEIEWVADERRILESHLVFCPSPHQEQKAKEKGIPFYSPKNLGFRNVRLYLKQILREFLDDLLTFRLIPPPHNKRILVLRVDAIGDYLLFRNFLKPLSEKFGKLTLIANKGCKEIIEQCDMDFLDEVIYFDRKKFTNNLLYRTRFLRKLRKQSFGILIHPTYGRDYCGEDIARKVIARQKIAPSGDCSNVLEIHKKRFDRNYTELLPNSAEQMFEFDRNFEFISQICQAKNIELSIQLPQQDLSHFELSDRYIVFFIGASTSCRKWSIDHLANLAQNFKNNYEIVICGGSEDWERGERLKRKIVDSKIKNLCGKTTLVELGLILQKSEFVISNETSCVHLYMGLDNKKKIYVLSAGNTIVRFTPYPQRYTAHYEVIFHPFIHKNFQEFLWISKNITHSGGGLEIDQIEPNEVLKRIEWGY